MPTPSSRPFSIAASTSKLDVDNRFPLKKYYRTADSLLKQAYIYREEKNIVELYILLLRFSSLVGETIPEHQDYRTSSVKEKAQYTKKFKQVLAELEKLKPDVQKQVEKLNNACTNNLDSENYDDRKYEWPPVSRDSALQKFNSEKKNWLLPSNGIPKNMQAKPYPTEDQFNQLSFSLPPAKDETLSRHSLLGPNGLRARWQMPVSQARVEYPSYIDASPIEIPSLDQNWNQTVSAVEAPSSATTSNLEEESTLHRESDAKLYDLASELSLIRQPSPPPVAALVQNLPAVIDTAEPSKCVDHVPPWKVADPFPGPVSTLADALKKTEGPKSLYISTTMMDEFLKLARQNTNNNIETCGVLAGSLRNATFYVTALIIPKQQATSDSCQTVNEEEIFDCQDKRGLFQLGWIHTHPTQTCFMSSVDLHTHYSYQVMLPEAIAIVMAPTDNTRKCGIFRLSEPEGVKVIQKCQMRGFHAHEQPSDGRSIYEQCGHVLMSSALRYQVIDLR